MKESHIYKMSEESRRHISIGHKGKPAWNKGKRMSEETRKKMSTAAKGKIISDETRRRMSIVQTGRHVSEETMEQINTKIICWLLGVG